jgi:hypothetical protein
VVSEFHVFRRVPVTVIPPPVMESTDNEPRPSLWHFTITDVLTLTALVGVTLILLPLLRAIVPDASNNYDRRQYIQIALNLSCVLWTIVFALNLFAGALLRRQPRLLTLGNASIIASFVCLVLLAIRLVAFRLYLHIIQRWAETDAFFNGYWSTFPTLRESTIWTLLGTPHLCAGACISASLIVLLTRRVQKCGSLADLLGYGIPILWLVNWLVTEVIWWLPIQWLTSSGIDW